jgi:hypothetical protein
MSEPERMATYWLHIALVRVKRGSTWINWQPRSRAFIAQRKPTG